MPEMPNWMDEPNPPPEWAVDLEPTDPPAPEWVSLAGEIEAVSGQRFLVRVSGKKQDERLLQCYADALYLQIEVVADPPELADRIAELEELAATVPATLQAEVEVPAGADSGFPRIVLETEPVSAGNSWTWAAKWSSLGAGCDEVWTGGGKWAKMKVQVGYADLRGVKGPSKAVYGGQETTWEVAAGRCRVHAFQWSSYKLNAGWHKQ
jgi:hypothetical protein